MSCLRCAINNLLVFGHMAYLKYHVGLPAHHASVVDKYCTVLAEVLLLLFARHHFDKFCRRKHYIARYIQSCMSTGICYQGLYTYIHIYLKRYICIVHVYGHRFAGEKMNAYGQTQDCRGHLNA